MINLNLPPLLRLCLGHVEPGGAIMTLGRQTIGFDSTALGVHVESGTLSAEAAGALQGRPLDQEGLLGAMGFPVVHSLDVSDYEGCTHVFDLNRPDCPDDWKGRYRAVLDGGTLEHVFEFTNGLRTSLDLLEPGGLFIHLGPMNNWVDHGFYQFSPTLWFDFLHENGFDVLISADVRLSRDAAGIETYRVLPAPPFESAPAARTFDRQTHMVAARRRSAPGTPWKTPSQSMYLERHGGYGRTMQVGTFLPFDVVDGRVTRHPRRLLDIAPAAITPVEGSGFRVDVRSLGLPGAALRRPFRSPSVVLEDGVPLPWAVSRPDMVVPDQPGRFIQEGQRMLFTASDGSDPRTNGRRYAISAPELPVSGI